MLRLNLLFSVSKSCFMILVHSSSSFSIKIFFVEHICYLYLLYLIFHWGFYLYMNDDPSFFLLSVCFYLKEKKEKKRNEIFYSFSYVCACVFILTFQSWRPLRFFLVVVIVIVKSENCYFFVDGTRLSRVCACLNSQYFFSFSSFVHIDTYKEIIY